MAKQTFLGTPLDVLWLNQGGKGSAPLLALRPTFASLRRPLFYGSALSVIEDGNSRNVWEKWFLKLNQSTTSNRGSAPVYSVWTTLASLRKDMRWGSRDYALRKCADDWFFGASSTFGRPVVRARPLQDAVAGIGGVNGWGGFPLLSGRVTRASLTPNHSFGNDDTELRTRMLGWFLGRTTGSEDMHVLYTGGLYPRDSITLA